MRRFHCSDETRPEKTARMSVIGDMECLSSLSTASQAFMWRGFINKPIATPASTRSHPTRNTPFTPNQIPCPCLRMQAQ